MGKATSNKLGFAFLGLLLTLQLSAQRPNILWLTCEDISPLLSMYGDSTANTPNLDKLASESLIFNEAYTTVGVCSSSRSSIITGQYPVSIGTHQMRSGKDIVGWGSRKYDGNSEAIDINGNQIPHHSVVTPKQTRCFTEYLRKEGYFCTNNYKTDCQFAVPVTAFDENSPTAHWKNRNETQPFFSIFNHNVTHESRLWMNKDKPLTVDPATVPLPPYFPDTEIVRNDVARMYANIELLDQQIGEKIKELEEAGLMDNTIIFFFSDHGGPLPRGKRAHYVSGLRVPMMIRIPTQLQQKYVDELISFVDLAPTVLSLANIKIPKQIQGQAFLGSQKAKKARQFIYGSGDRFDEYSDRVRSVISKDFVYVKNYHQDLPAYKDVAYRKNIPMTIEMLEMHSKGELNKQQSYWFRKNKTEEEFYVRTLDPFQLNNIASKIPDIDEFNQMKKALKRWQRKIKDVGAIPEKEYLATRWVNGIQPQAEQPIVKEKNGKISMSMKGASGSIAYHISKEESIPNLDSGWMVYSEPVLLKPGEHLYILGTRLGYKDSELVKW